MNNIKLIAIGIAVALILSMLGGAVWYYKWTQKEIGILRDNNAKLELAVETNEKAIDSVKKDVALSAVTLQELDVKFQESRKESDVIREKLSRHDIGYLASRKPGLVEKAVNKGTADVGRCYEILSGAPLTEAELAATKKSQANSICPDIANPNYEAKP